MSVYELLNEDFSDVGNAALFEKAYHGTVAYSDALGWLCFDGKRWTPDDHGAVEAAVYLTEGMLDEALAEYTEATSREADAKVAVAAGDDSARDELAEAKKAVKRARAQLDHAKKSRQAPRIRGMLDLAIPALVVKADQLDADPFVLNTPSGTVDLRTGQLKPHDIDSPYLWCTHMTTVKPMDYTTADDAEGYKLWYDFLELITCKDYSLAGFLQLVAGMALVGRVYHEGIIIANGSGRNGKSTFFNALAGVLGDYSGSIDPRILTTDRQNKGAALATLRGKRLVIAAELEEHQRLSTSTLKQLASTDMLTIEEKFRQPETIRQTHTLALFTNFLPRVGSTDNGTWRRLTVIPFNAVIPESDSVQNYSEYLIDKAGPAILSWAIEGASNFIRNGYKLSPVPLVVEEATDIYRQRENWLENFIADRCIKEPNARVGAHDLYVEYKEWSLENGEYLRRENDFSEAMMSAGYQRITPKNRKTYVGLRMDLATKYGNPCAATV